MRKIWFLSALSLLAYEWLRVYFIMPMPGSQKVNSLEWAYDLYQYRWVIRLLLIVVIAVFFTRVWPKFRISSLSLLILIGVSTYLTNFPMSADTMFLTMNDTRWEKSQGNKIELDRLVLGVEQNGVFRAYPVNILAHHHQVIDTLEKSAPIFATYCSVCRTGMVYKHPQKEGKLERFRLVGMDHYNAMFEDESTQSWWQQATGEAVIGERKGEKWEAIPSVQTTLGEWLTLHPESWILQEDSAFTQDYNDLKSFDDGSIKSGLLNRKKELGHAKNWVAWIRYGTEVRSYSWEEIERRGWLFDTLGGKRIVIGTTNKKSLMAFVLPEGMSEGDVNSGNLLKLFSESEKVESHQEFRHSFDQFRKGK